LDGKQAENISPNSSTQLTRKELQRKWLDQLDLAASQQAQVGLIQYYANTDFWIFMHVLSARPALHKVCASARMKVFWDDYLQSQQFVSWLGKYFQLQEKFEGLCSQDTLCSFNLVYGFFVLARAFLFMKSEHPKAPEQANRLFNTAIDLKNFHGMLFSIQMTIDSFDAYIEGKTDTHQLNPQQVLQILNQLIHVYRAAGHIEAGLVHAKLCEYFSWNEDQVGLQTTLSQSVYHFAMARHLLPYSTHEIHNASLGRGVRELLRGNFESLDCALTTCSEQLNERVGENDTQIALARAENDSKVIITELSSAQRIIYG